MKNFCKMLRLLLFIIFFTIPFLAFAQGFSEGFSEGDVVRQNGSAIKYLIANGQKLRIADKFTLRELGVAAKNIKTFDKETLDSIPDGEVLKISQPKIRGIFDMHEHFREGGGIELYLKIAKKLGIEKTVFVPTGSGPANAGYKKHMEALLKKQKKYPSRVIAFCTVDEADPEAPRIFEKCLDDGGKGLKLLGGHPNFYDVPLNNEIVKELFKIAGERDVPLIVHISVITLPQAKQELIDLLEQFPNVSVQFAHYCSTIYNGINLDQCADLLDRYPNLYIDLSMGGGINRYFKYMTEDMRKIKDFVVKYQDRILYGTDIIVAERGPTKNPKWLRSRIMCDLSLHQEKWYRCPVMNKGQYNLLPGFFLDEEILRKMYIENPKKLLKL